MRGTRAAVLAAGLALVATVAVVSTRALDEPSPGTGTPSGSAGARASESPGAPSQAASGPDGQVQEGYGAEASLDAVRAVLDARSEAVLAGDRKAFMATVDDVSPRFVAQQAATYENLQRLGVAEMGYGVDGRMLPVSPVKGDDLVIKPTVIEHVQIEGVDSRVVSHEVGFTFVERDDGWRLGAERIDETQRTLSSIGVSRPWAEGPIAVRRQGPLTVVVDEERADALPSLTSRASEALAYVRGELAVRDDETLLLDATSTGTPTRLDHHGSAVAGATFGPAMTMALTGHEPIGIGGWRIKYNPDRLDLFLDDDRILRHELTHFVLREKDHPLWLMEGLAEYLGWRQAPMTRLYVPAATFDRLATRMPQDRFLGDAEFNTVPLVGYIGSQALVEELVARQGLEGVLDLVDAYARLRTSDVPRGEVDRRALADIFASTEAELAAAGYRRLMGIQHP